MFDQLSLKTLHKQWERLVICENDDTIDYHQGSACT